MNQPPKKSISQEIKTQVTILGSFVALFWILEILDTFVFKANCVVMTDKIVQENNILYFYPMWDSAANCYKRTLDSYGIVPHSIIGLRGILFAPFLHGGFGHLIANTIPFIVLGWFVMLQETSDFWIVTIITTLVGGAGVWLFAPPNSVHIGASILIFGYLGFLLLRGYFQRNIASIILSLVVFLLYGGAIWGILPTQPHVSWQGHLFGFLGGVLAARLIAKEKHFYS